MQIKEGEEEEEEEEGVEEEAGVEEEEGGGGMEEGWGIFILFLKNEHNYNYYVYLMLNKNTLGVKKVQGQSEAALQTGATKNFDIS